MLIAPSAYFTGWPYEDYLDYLDRLTVDQREELIICDHLPVVTLGRNFNREDPIYRAENQEPNGHSHSSNIGQNAPGHNVFWVDRGGQLTFHEPGQLVFYPVIDLKKRGLRIADFVQLLQQTLLDFCTRLVPDTEFIFESSKPGLYCRNNQPASAGGTDGSSAKTGWPKVASIGISVKRGFTRHGIALNLENRLELGRQVIACGEANRRLVSLVELNPDLETNQILKETKTRYDYENSQNYSNLHHAAGVFLLELFNARLQVKNS